MIQFLLPAAAGFIGRMLGKSGAEAEAGEKMDAIKQLVNLTPEQSQAVEAIKTQPIEEVRDRVTLGIGPLSPLPAHASQRAQEIRNARIAASKGVVTPADQAQVAAAQDPQAAMKAIVDRKVAEIMSAR